MEQDGENASVDDLMGLVLEIVPFHMEHNAEPEAVDLLLGGKAALLSNATDANCEDLLVPVQLRITCPSRGCDCFKDGAFHLHESWRCPTPCALH